MKNTSLSRLRWLTCSFLATLLLISAQRSRGSDLPAASYETGFPSLTQIGANLHQALDPKRRQQISPQPVLLDQMATPCITPGAGQPGTPGSQTVQVSAGFVQFINQLAHARAIEESAKGFLKTYTATLPSAAGDTPLPALPSSPGRNLWDAETLNYQVGNFNQMAGALLAIEMAHHYLGHSTKYTAAPATTPGPPVAINTVITEKEWREAVMKGAKNALDCGYGVDGIRCVLASLGSIPQRPPWAAYFVHPEADVSKISRDLAKLEKDFFLVGK